MKHIKTFNNKVNESYRDRVYILENLTNVEEEIRESLVDIFDEGFNIRFVDLSTGFRVIISGAQIRFDESKRNLVSFFEYYKDIYKFKEKITLYIKDAGGFSLNIKDIEIADQLVRPLGGFNHLNSSIQNDSILNGIWFEIDDV